MAIPTFQALTKDFFIYDICPIVRQKIVRGEKFSRSNIDSQRSYLQNIFNPIFGNMLVDKITEHTIESFISIMIDRGYAPNSINNYLATLRNIFNYTLLKKIIRENPMNHIKPLKSEVIHEKGILNQEQVKQLFQPGNLDTVWNGNVMHRILNKLAATTGMRMGEIQALQQQHVHTDSIEIFHSWDRKYGLKDTKSGKNRVVPITKELYLELKSQFKSQDQSSYIFSTDGKKPIDHKAIQKWLYRALANINIDSDKRKNMNLSFHSWRHYCNSRLLANGMPPYLVQQLIGHESDSMTKNYSHFEKEDMNQILSIQNELG
ncbi:MAG: tyrosine-type recombinase/integrase [Spirochaetaceae bacterium]|nr:tyrosine-type recombinase/integrase [Spirochaetaceae bacterium]